MDFNIDFKVIHKGSFLNLNLGCTLKLIKIYFCCLFIEIKFSAIFGHKFLWRSAKQKVTKNPKGFSQLKPVRGLLKLLLLATVINSENTDESVFLEKLIKAGLKRRRIQNPVKNLRWSH